MKLMDLLTGIEHADMFDAAKLNTDVKRLISNSRDAQEGDLFVAIKGDHFDGHDFLNYVAGKGVEVVIVEEPALVRSEIMQIKVKDTRRALSILARNFYNDPSGDIRLIGITGTNGKTTVSYLIESILREAQIDTGRVGTIDYRIGDKILEARYTTPDVLTLNSLLSKMVEQNIPYCIIEVSSHGLEQGRVMDLKFNSAVFTNLSHEHLDYHKTLDAYLNAKLKLFEGLESSAYAVVNKDTPYLDDFISRIKSDLITYGIKSNADITTRDLKIGSNGSKVTVCTPQGPINIQTSLVGRHNIYNILAAAAAAVKEGLNADVIKRGIENLKLVPGRMEAIDCGQGFNVFVDYAHTEDALRNALSAVRAINGNNKLILVFGCGGDRDKAKRPKMGKVAAELADFTIITSDNPRSEDPAVIAKEIKEGFKGTKAKHVVVLDRFKAIEKAVAAADNDMAVLIAGKGHEKQQIFRDRIIPFDDRQVVLEALKRLR